MLTLSSKISRLFNPPTAFKSMWYVRDTWKSAIAPRTRELVNVNVRDLRGIPRMEKDSTLPVRGTRERRAAFIANRTYASELAWNAGLLQQVRGKLFKGHAYISRQRCSCTSRPRKNMQALARAPVSRHRNAPLRMYCLCRCCLYLCTGRTSTRIASVSMGKFLRLQFYIWDPRQSGIILC